MSHTIKRKQYQTTTPTGLYEANYRRLLRLLPDVMLREVGEVIELSAQNTTITILEQFKYTSLIQLKQTFDTQFNHLSSIEMELRICHDASLLEVVGYQGRNPVQSALYYPNKHMLQLDEKKQLNLLLKEILESSIRHKRYLMDPVNP